MMFIYNVGLRSMQRHDVYIQRRINVDATSWRLYNVGLMLMQRHNVYRMSD